MSRNTHKYVPPTVLNVLETGGQKDLVYSDGLLKANLKERHQENSNYDVEVR